MPKTLTATDHPPQVADLTQSGSASRTYATVSSACERCGSELTPGQQKRRARFCKPRCRAAASRLRRQGPGEFRVFIEMVSERLEKGAIAYGNKSFSQEPAELLREIDEEIADVCGWSFILHVRVRRLIESIESQRRANPQFKTVNPKPKEAIHGNHEEQGS